MIVWLPFMKVTTSTNFAFFSDVTAASASTNRWVISQEHIFRGDALIMRVGARDCHSVVNMRDHDTVLSDYAIIKYVLSA